MAEPVANSVEFFKSLMEEAVAEDPRYKNNLGKILLCAMRRHPKDMVFQISVPKGVNGTLLLSQRCPPAR
ncbi:hypothetical protein EVAR_103371_1 [Eumeta japonica]|uniref:Uncharacterized protein n=1 Tax=Eumeta variegata TaxID=151549 RepID=A0A4C1YAJ5_EUMVA|nr:hypothetical protein EVAR_103371_1 [Eumeta japonica]